MSANVPAKAVKAVARAGRTVGPVVLTFVGARLTEALNDPQRLEAWFSTATEQVAPRPRQVLSVEEIEDCLDAVDVVLAEHGDALPAEAPAQQWGERVRRLRVALTVTRSAPAQERVRQTARVQREAERPYRALSKALIEPGRQRMSVPRLRRRMIPLRQG